MLSCVAGRVRPSLCPVPHAVILQYQSLSSYSSVFFMLHAPQIADQGCPRHAFLARSAITVLDQSSSSTVNAFESAMGAC